MTRYARTPKERAETQHGRTPKAYRNTKNVLIPKELVTSSEERGVTNKEVVTANQNRARHEPAMRAATGRDLTMNPRMSDFVEFAQRTGMTYRKPDGSYRRDVYDALGYERTLTAEMYRGRYERGGIARRIVEAYPRATWGGGVEVIENQNEDIETAFEIKCAKLFERLDLWTALQRADILAGLGPFSILFIGARGGMATPLKGDVAYVRPLWYGDVTIKSVEKDPSNPRFGQPDMYDLKFGNDINKTVHWTRVIHIADGGLENDIYGSPRLRACWNYLDDLEKIVGGGCEAAWKRMDPGLQIDVDPTIVMGPDEEDLFDEQVDDYEHGLARTMRTRGTTITPLSASVAAFGPNAAAIIELISASEGIPQRILLGSESGKLAAGQDSDNWYSRVMERRRTYAAPIIRGIVNRFSECKCLPAPVSGNFSVRWPQAERLDEAQKASVASALANANAANVGAGGDPIMTATEIRARVFRLDPLTDEQIAEMKKVETTAPDATNDNGSGSGMLDADKTVIDIKAGPTQQPKHSHNAESGQSDQDKALALADKATPRIAATALALFLSVAASVSASGLEDDLVLHDERAAENRIVSTLDDVVPHFTSRLHFDLHSVFAKSGKAMLASAISRDSWIDNKLRSPVDAGRDEGEVTALSSETEFRSLAAKFPRTFDITNPRAIAWAKVRSAALIVEINERTRKAIRYMVSKGLEEGIAPKRLATLILQRIGLREDQVIALENFAETGASTAQVAKYAKQLLRDRALLIAKTETANAANAGQLELWIQAQEDGYLDPLQKRKWVGIPDGRERKSHVWINNQPRGLTEHFRKQDGTSIEPGQEPNCLLPGAVVEGQFVAGLKAAYAGPVVEIVTSRGHRLSLTINHPVFTSDGWIPAGELQKGMNLLCDSMTVGVGREPHSSVSASSTRQVDNYQSPASIEEVFQSLLLQRLGTGLVTIEAAAHHLHGDAVFTDGKIDIVGSNSKLRLDIDLVSLHRNQEVMLPLSNTEKSFISSFGSRELGFESIHALATSNPRSSALATNGGGASLETTPLDVLRLGAASNWDVPRSESSHQSGAVDSGFVGQLLHRSAGQVQLDEIVEILHFDFRGHVYDLQSTVGWMIANGIVISNCRCGQVLITAAEANRLRRQKEAA